MSSADWLHAYASDAIAIYVHALTEMLRRRENIYDGTLLYERLLALDFVGRTGRVAFAEGGYRHVSVQLLNKQASGDRVVLQSVETPDADDRRRGAAGGAGRTGRGAKRGREGAGHGGSRGRLTGRSGPRGWRAVAQTAAVVYAGNQSAFDGQARYRLAPLAGTPATYRSDNNGEAVAPALVVGVRLWDGGAAPAALRKQVYVDFVPRAASAYAGHRATGTAAWIVDSEVAFRDVVFYGARGVAYDVRVWTGYSLRNLSLVLEVLPCPNDTYVLDHEDCAPCPSGAVCDGTATLRAAPNHWRTGGYDAAGAYVPNTNETTFLRCSTAACLGGADMACYTGRGVCRRRPC